MSVDGKKGGEGLLFVYFSAQPLGGSGGMLPQKFLVF